ncbi:AI-2E family transporter, partial [bacterium]|nr:AI-2E family transporter [bacterium]
LAAIGVKMAAVIALLAFAFNFVPNVGPIVATLTPVPVMLLSGQSSITELLLAVLLPGLIHFVVGHLVEPKVMGSNLELDPVVILLGLMLAELMWGPVGMLLAMPLMVVARILLDQTAETRPLVNLLSGRLPGSD